MLGCGGEPGTIDPWDLVSSVTRAGCPTSRFLSGLWPNTRDGKIRHRLTLACHVDVRLPAQVRLKSRQHHPQFCYVKLHAGLDRVWSDKMLVGIRGAGREPCVGEKGKAKDPFFPVAHSLEAMANTSAV